MVTNRLTWSELRSLVSFSSAVAVWTGNEFLSARNIELDTYAALLGERRADLEAGFLDTLGFPASLLSTRGIRHCPVCTKAGYHCTLFSLGALTYCPWHRIPLTQGCVQCAKVVRTMGPLNFSEIVTCPGCGMRIVDPAYRLCGVVDPGIRRAAEGCCREITAWWRTVSTNEQATNELMGDSLRAATKADPENQIALKWGAVCALALPPESWLTNICATPANIVRWQECRRDAVNDIEAGRTPLIQCYRSVRRQIFRKFVRPHRRCLSILTSAKRPDLYCLDREQACAVCIAFIAWRRAIEQEFDAVEQVLHKMKQTNTAFPRSRVFRYLSDRPPTLPTGRPFTFADRPVRSWRLRMPNLGGSAPSIELVPRVLYAEFLRIWMELEVGHIGTNLKIIVNPLGARNLQLPAAASAYGGELLSNAAVSGWTVVLPDALALARQAWERCTQRESHSWSMFDAQPQVNAQIFTWRPSESIDLLFMLRYRHDSSARVFRYVCL
ncbi:hypothetical protein [Burkholderia diffusa]|uniref:hypothetical protein n=1 Tax=Burkholderia diffusa TaxID=488732 RepID=UPI0012D8846E|nr:hypothetical protein [Burkholderia diffusa]